jgi:hypothetical protein
MMESVRSTAMNFSESAEIAPARTSNPGGPIGLFA